uniref:Arogenate dehydratase n=1 Tax=Pinus pinaster TaxID=71647 RepID=A0A1I9WKA5_PINPS|nr:arogenate dehydratase [Pinus pinaster]
MALRYSYISARPEGRKAPLDVKNEGFCSFRRSFCVFGQLGDGQAKGAARRSVKSNRVKSPFKPIPVEDLGSYVGQSERTVLDQLERIYRQGMLTSNGDSNDVLLPMEPLWTGPLFEGKPVKVAYQGVRGSYCQEAAIRAFQRCDALPCEGEMESAFEALESDAADRAVLPVENSLDGVIGRNYDLMLRHPDLHVVGEVLLRINHCLLAVRGAEKRRTLKRVISHPQALAHCQRCLGALGVEVEAVDNAASAARFVAENRIDDTAVIGSAVAGREYGLEVVEEEMQDDSSNATRFLILTKKNPNNNSSAVSGLKTTVAFSLKEGTTDLCKALSIFAARDIKVTKIESRPQRENPLRMVRNEEQERKSSKCYFEYVFFVDLEAPVADDHPGRVQMALDSLRQIAGFVRVIGNYSVLSVLS